MDLYEAINSRASTREFTGEPVPAQVVARLLASAVKAPTAGNLQPWRFFVVSDRRVKRGLRQAAFGQAFLEEAPVVIVVCADLDVCADGYGSRGEQLYSIQDTAAAVENILLSAVAEGFAACWVGAFDEEAAREALDLAQGVRPLAMVPVGKAARPGVKRPREPFEKFTEYI
jgi:nitroreductase